MKSKRKGRMVASFGGSRDSSCTVLMHQSLLVLLALLLQANANGHERQQQQQQQQQQHLYSRIVRPRVVPPPEPSRDRRSLGLSPASERPSLQFLDLGDWILETEAVRGVAFSPRLSVEWMGSATKPLQPLDSCESRQGEVHGQEGNSRVVLTRCRDDLFGLVNLENRTYLLEPLHPRTGDEHLLFEAGSPRRVRRGASSALYEASRRFYNLSGDTFGPEDYEESPELLSGEPPGDLGRSNELGSGSRPEEPGANVDDGVGYFYDRSWQRERLPTRKTMSKFSPAKWLELAIVADYSVIDFHGSRVQQYILALLNIVSAIYKDSSLDSNMQLVVVRMIFYTDKKDGMVHQGNARRSLENVNKWNRKLLGTPNGTHDVAVWLTRLDIGGPSGYAPVSGACDPSRSCALNRDEGLTSAFIIAHEVAHILGLSHDGDKNSGNTCAREAARGSIMAPMVAATFHNFHWSTCSRKEFHRRAKHWTCLLNRPNDDDSPIVRGSPNEVFSMDEQCRMEFGEGYSRCRNLESSNLCAHLWCGRANSSSAQACKTKKGPPLEGTMCAENKWCVNGLCETIDRKRSEPTPLAVRGAPSNTWSSWGAWGECSGTCGIAVQYRQRHCSGFCEGDSSEFRVCELPACQERRDPRALQCSRLFEDRRRTRASRKQQGPADGNETWLPYEDLDGAPSCQLVCLSPDTGEVFHTGLDVEDGTACSYETSDICVDGTCRPMGCDGVLGSGRARDACGQCDGNNSTCESVAGKFQRKLRRETTRLAVIPRFSYNIKVVVTILLADSVPHEGNMKILIRDGQRRRYEISEFDGDGRAPVMIVEGAAFRIERLEEKYVLWSRGPVSSEIVVSLVASREVVRGGASIAASSQYAIARAELRSVRGRYVWVAAGPVGPCSASCGGGFRRRSFVCRDEVTRELVSRRKCLLAAKPPGHRELERCNTGSCEYTWIPGTWERCSASGSSASGDYAGTQQRLLYCVRSSFAERQVTRENEFRVYRNTVAPSKCRDQWQPPTERECSRPPACTGRWVYTDWSPCSQSCGRGVQTRRARCLTTGMSGTSGERPEDEETRVCQGRARHDAPECAAVLGRQRCRGDRHRQRLCVGRDLASLCKDAAFRRRCCLTCRGN